MFALTIPRRLLWAFPDEGKAVMDSRFTTPYRVIPSNLLKSFNISFNMPIEHSVKRVYQLVDVDEGTYANV